MYKIDKIYEKVCRLQEYNHLAHGDLTIIEEYLLYRTQNSYNNVLQLYLMLLSSDYCFHSHRVYQSQCT
jgi:hypothetical protein